MKDVELLSSLTADIVASHVAHNAVGVGELPKLIAGVHRALASLGAPPVTILEAPTPAVSIRASVKPDMLTCLDCGKKLKMLKRHLTADHDMNPADYKAKWGLGSDYPMVAPDYAATRKTLAHKIGLGRKPGTQVDAKPVKAAPSRKKIGIVDPQL